MIIPLTVGLMKKMPLYKICQYYATKADLKGAACADSKIRFSYLKTLVDKTDINKLKTVLAVQYDFMIKKNLEQKD